MKRITRLHSDLSRLGRETEMLDAVITMLEDEFLTAPAADGTPRADVLDRLIHDALALTETIYRALGEPLPTRHASNSNSPSNSTAGKPDQYSLGDLPRRFRQSHHTFEGAARRLIELPPETAIPHRGQTLTPDDVVPQRIAEVVLAHDNLQSAWTIEEADPDSVLDALEAILRRLCTHQDLPPVTIETEEGERWELGNGGPLVYGDREHLTQWLTRGESAELETDGDLPALPQWH